MRTTHKVTIGFISTWPIYQGTTIDRYAHSLIQGISAAVNEKGYNLLLGCGFSAIGNTPQNRSFWPVPGPNINFVPVGPWNTDGLIIVPDELTTEQSEYVHDLLASGFPVIFTTPEGPGPVVAVDNTLGIRQAFEHLRNHGHTKIAFIAGNIGHGGDSEERLQAYRLALKDSSLPEDSRLIAFGEHRRDAGKAAMQKILDSGVNFTALIASNDLSCLGAIECLKEAGCIIPNDVAVIGFDDILDARSLSPSLTTIRHPTFSLGYQAVITLLAHIRGNMNQSSHVVVPPRLIIRQSCGCPSSRTSISFSSDNSIKPTLKLNDLARAMAEAALIEARNSLLEDLHGQCSSFLDSLLNSVKSQDTNLILSEIKKVLIWTDERDEDAHIWQAGIAILYQNMNTLLNLVPEANQGFVISLIDRVQLEISDQIQRRTTRSMIEHMDMMSQLGMMTAELLTAMNVSESAEILTRHLPKVGIKNLLVALYDNNGEDHTSHATILFTAGLPSTLTGQRFETRKFPMLGIYPANEPIHLTILPLNVDEKMFGFAAFDASNPELCAAIVHNLGAALRTSSLYNDAVQGRRMAEEANRLKSRFLSTVSHELRTPLSLIVGLSEMILREQKEHAHTTLRDMEQINASAQHLARLIGDVLDLASSEAGQLHILREPLDLAEVLHMASKIGGELAREKGLAWSAQLASRGPWVMGDRTRLRQVTLNLISNAIKFTPAGQVCLEVAVAKDKVIISVSDTGIGISPDDQRTIFNEFYRSQNALESGYGGLGLGLAISKELIEQHGGQIEVHSPGDLGRGSTFSFCLPILSITDSPLKISPTFPATTSLVILLTEGNEATDTLSAYLTSRGFSIQVCRVDAENDWLAKIIQTSPSAIILSEHLASREGWGIIGMLKRQNTTENIPVLACSLNTANDQGQILELNYLHKPLKLDQLTKELKRLGASSVDKPQNVLVVDDDPGILDMHSRLIEQAGCRVITAHNGREALTCVAEQIPDLILLDLMMPEMDGFAVLDELHAKESTREIPIIILTARLLSDADLARCNQGVASILGKGLFSAEETLRHIETALTRQHTLNRATQQLIRKAMTYIHAHYAESITREGIAEHVGISADYLTDCFRQELGITPITYIRRYRIRRACELLQNSDQPITQIALAVGFSDGAHFTRTFQREMKMTPRAYRHNK